jgi:Protein of unknown function (DUF559)
MSVTLYLAGEGWKVLRFWSNEVSQNREGVLETILAHAAKPSSGPSGHLLPGGEGALNDDAENPSPSGEGGAPKA